MNSSSPLQRHVECRFGVSKKPMTLWVLALHRTGFLSWTFSQFFTPMHEMNMGERGIYKECQGTFVLLFSCRPSRCAELSTYEHDGLCGVFAPIGCTSQHPSNPPPHHVAHSFKTRHSFVRKTTKTNKRTCLVFQLYSLRAGGDDEILERISLMLHLFFFTPQTKQMLLWWFQEEYLLVRKHALLTSPRVNWSNRHETKVNLTACLWLHAMGPDTRRGTFRSIWSFFEIRQGGGGWLREPGGLPWHMAPHPLFVGGTLRFWLLC